MSLNDAPSPTTPRRAGRAKVQHVTAVRSCQVSRVTPLTPTIVRLTLAGEDLDGFVSLGPTDHLKLSIPATLVLEATEAGAATASLRPDEVVVRDYTPRAHRQLGGAGVPELDLDIALHGTDGPISAWASRAKVGDPVTVAGPRSSKLVPPDATSFLLGCDESGLPAVARWLELVDPEVPMTVLAAVVDSSVQDYPLARRESVAVHWLTQDAAPPAVSATRLEAAVRERGALADGCFAWFGGEAGSLVGVRRYLRRELGLGADRVEVSGYWRLGAPGYDHHAPIDAADPE